MNLGQHKNECPLYKKIIIETDLPLDRGIILNNLETCDFKYFSEFINKKMNGSKHTLIVTFTELVNIPIPCFNKICSISPRITHTLKL